MSHVAIPSKILQIGGENQDQLVILEDQLKMAVLDYKVTNTLLQDEPENAFAKEEVRRLGALIRALAKSQKSILQEIRKKSSEPITVELAMPKDNKSPTSSEIDAASVTNGLSSMEKENESNADNRPIKVEYDAEILNGLKKENSESQEPDHGKCLLVASQSKRHKPPIKTETTNAKLRSTSPFGFVEEESETDAMVNFLRILELIPMNELRRQYRKTEKKRAIRLKRSTANHSQFVYDDSWDKDDENQKRKKKDTVPVALKTMKPVPENEAIQLRPSSRKRASLLAHQPIKYHEEKKKPKICALNGNEMFPPRKSLAPSILQRSKPKQILPNPANVPVIKIPSRRPNLKNEEQGKTKTVVPYKVRKVVSEPEKKLGPKKRAIDFSLEKMPLPGWNTTISTCQKQEKPVLVQCTMPPGLSLKIPGLPDSLTIERIPEQQRVCCMCRKPALMTGLFGETEKKISDALTSCNDCAMSYHLSCTSSTSTSNEIHICPHCFSKQSTYPSAVGSETSKHTSAKAARNALLLEKIRLTTEKEALNRNLLELGTDVTCTFTRGGKPI